MIENAHKHLERAPRGADGRLTAQERWGAIEAAAREVGPALFFSLLIIKSRSMFERLFCLSRRRQMPYWAR